MSIYTIEQEVYDRHFLYGFYHWGTVMPKSSNWILILSFYMKATFIIDVCHKFIKQVQIYCRGIKLFFFPYWQRRCKLQKALKGKWHQAGRWAWKSYSIWEEILLVNLSLLIWPLTIISSKHLGFNTSWQQDCIAWWAWGVRLMTWSALGTDRSLS